MMTIDQILINLVNNNFDELKKIVLTRDSKVLISLSKIVASPLYITENQSRLLLKILGNYQEPLSLLISDLSTALQEPNWSKPFRQIDTTKKMYITVPHDGPAKIAIEFAFSAALRNLIHSISSKITMLSQEVNGKLYSVDLTENNIVVLVDEFEKHNFEIDEKLKNYRKIIKSWSEKEVRDQFLLTNITHQNFQKQITADLGIETAIDQNIITDRSMRYQYFCEKSEKLPATLTYQIANRTTTKIWLNKKDVALENIFESLAELKRFPVLVVFDTYEAKKCVEDLTKLSKSLENSGIFNNIGIYFRLDNSEVGKQFNQLIAEKQYNCQLTESTKVVGVQNGKIPKFLLKSAWKPMSVISIGNPLRHSKTAVYSNCCDLIISYTETEPIVETRFVWE